jgi:hypothetical protein
LFDVRDGDCAVVVGRVARVIHFVDAVAVRHAGVAEVVFYHVFMLKNAVFVPHNRPLSMGESIERSAFVFNTVDVIPSVGFGIVDKDRFAEFDARRVVNELNAARLCRRIVLELGFTGF